MAKRKYLKGDERRRVACALKRRYEDDGLSVRQIAAETGYSEGKVADLLWFVGTAMRPGRVSPDSATGS